MKLNNPKLSLTFLGGDTFSSSLEITNQYILKEFISSTFQLFSSLKSSSRQISLSLKRKTPAIESIIKTEGDIKAVLTDGDKTIFTGYLSTNFSWILGEYGEEALSITIEDVGSKLLGKAFIKSGSHLFKCSASNAIKAVCDRAGVELSSTIPTINTNIVRVVSEGETCKDILSTMLYELGYVYYFEDDGKMNLFSFLNLPKTESTVLNGTSIVVKGSTAISLSKSIRQYNSAKVKFTELEEVSDYLVYRNTTNKDSSHPYCNLVLKSNEAFDGSEIYAIDESSTRTPTKIEAVNAESETTVIGSRKIIAIENVSSVIEKYGSITASVVGSGGPYLEINAQNKSNSAYAITRLDAYADVLYQKATSVVLAGDDTTSSDNTLEEEMKYIHVPEDVKKHASLIAQYYKYSSANYTFYTKDDIVLGSVVRLNDDVHTGLNVLVLVYAKIENDTNGIIEYKAVGYSEFDFDKASIITRQLISPVKDMGARGEKGDAGSQGEKGDKGDKGDTGEQGIQGDKGDKGDTGSQGPKGDTGPQGEQGIQGPQGETGAKGDKGDTGAQGPKGDKGATGAQGPQGEKGETGEKGDKGDTGSSGVGISSITEYYAVSSSNSTAPSSWSTSVPTLTATNKYLWNYEVVTYTDSSKKETSKRVIGVYGDKGATGAKGDKGETGATGSQGPQGEKGEKGDTGEQGPQGIQGATGAKGDTGATGNGIASIVNYYLASSSSTGITKSTSGWTTTVQSVTSTKKYLWNYEKITYTNSNYITSTPCIIGVYGDKGDTGAKGDKGDTGATGAQGPQGEKGDTGAKGDKGETGATGAKGDTGAKGADARTYVTLTSGYDLNNCITKDYVYVSSSTAICNSLLNKPADFVAGEVRVEVEWLGSNSYLIQRLYCKASSISKSFTRTYNAGSFGSWVEQGAKGDKGETGAKGDKGDKGDAGVTGSSITTSVQYLLSTSSTLTESQQASLTTWVDGTALSWSYGYYIYKRLKKENVDNGSVTYTYLGRDTAQENYYKSLLSFSITADRSTYFKNLRAQASETTTIQIKVNDRYYSPSSINWTLNGSSFSPTYSSGLYSFTVPLKNPKDSYTVKATPVKNSSAITGASSSIVLTVVDITENYKFFGSVTSLSSVGSGQVLLDGDSCFLTTANAIYVYQSGSWVEFNSCTLSDDIKTLILSKAQKAAFEYAESNELSQDYGYFKTLVAKYIYARNIGVEDLKLDEGGTIRSGGYLVDGTNPTGNSGIYINADGKVLMEDAQVNGSFSNTKINANESQTILWSKALPFLYLDGDYNSRDELYSPSELVKKAFSSLVDGSTEKFIYTKAMYFSANGSYAPIFVYNASSSNISEISAGIYFKHGYASGMIYNGSSYEGYLIVVSDSAITESALKSTSYFASARFSFETSLLLGCIGGCPRILVPSSKAEHRTIGDIFDPTLVHNLAEGTATWVPCILVEDVVYECTENFVITVLNNSTISQSSPYKEPVKTTQTLGKYIKLSKLAGSSSSNLYYHFSTDKNTWTVLGDSVFFTDLTVAANTDSATITGKFNFFQATSLEVRDLNKANSSFDETCKISVYSLYSSRIYTQDLRASWSIATEHLQANDVAAGEVCAQDLKADVARHNSILPLVNVDSNVGSTIAPFKKIYADELIGKLSGNVNGNVTGNTSGTHTGNVTGNVNSRGDTTHEVWCAVFN